MKRLITNTFQLNIDTYFQLLAEYVAATAINPILVNGEVDDAARADYQVFISQVLELFEYYDLVTLDAHQGGSSPHTSYYYKFAHKQQVEAMNIPKIIDVRISDHIQNFSPERERQLSKQRRQKLEELKQPKSKRIQKYVPVDIIVNKNTFHTYEDALTYVEQQIRNWLRSANVDPNDYEEFGEW